MLPLSQLYNNLYNIFELYGNYTALSDTQVAILVLLLL